MTIAAWVASERERLLDELRELTAIPSIAATGEGIVAASSWVADRFGRLGARVTRLSTSGHPVVFAEVGPAGAPALLVYNHYDVQPADPAEGWVSPPFAPTIRDGALYARGVADNKANLLSRIQALEAWRDVHGELPLRVLFLVEGEEEIGSPNLAGTCEGEGARWADAAGCLWEAGYRDMSERLVLTSGCKGLAAFELRAHGPRDDMHSAFGTLMPNAAWRLVWALAALKAPDETLLIPGILEHVRPPSAADRAALDGVPWDDAALRALHGVDAFVGGVTGHAALERHLFAPTCTIQGLRAGYTGDGVKTVLPARALARLDFRLVPDLTPELVAEALRRHLDAAGCADVEAVLLAGELPGPASGDGAPVRAALAAASRVYGAEPIYMPVMPGTGPMHPVAAAFGIPVVGFGTSYWASGAHAPNEHVRLGDYFAGVAMTAAFVEEFAGLARS